MPTATAQYPVVTRREAAAILAAERAIADIRDRAGRRSYRDDAAVARSNARIASSAEHARSALLDLLICGKVDGASPQAADALDRYQGKAARNGD